MDEMQNNETLDLKEYEPRKKKPKNWFFLRIFGIIFILVAISLWIQQEIFEKNVSNDWKLSSLFLVGLIFSVIYKLKNRH